MKNETFIKKFLKHSTEFQDCDGEYCFNIAGTDYMLDTTGSGRILLWRDYGTLVAWTEDMDYEALAQMAFDELENA